MDRRAFLHLLSLGTFTAGVYCHRQTGALAAGTQTTKSEVAAVKNWAWVNRYRDLTDDEVKQRLTELQQAGVTSILAGGGEQRVYTIAHDLGFETHAWMWTLCRYDNDIVENHPEWFAVNRLGESTLDQPPYVNYYHFLCPSRKGVREYLARKVAELAELDCLDGVHLDYIRYPDVILPRALWEKYDLVQDTELPQFDYCYCEECRRIFAEQTGLDPLDMKDPTIDTAWRRYRYDSVTRLVNELADVVHAREKKITAAVFPTPSIARQLVRQDWPRWNLDAFLPMVYHHFYEKDIPWIQEAVAEGVGALPDDRPLYAGLYLPSLKSDEDFKRAVAAAMAGGARGVSLFGGVRSIPASADSTVKKQD